MAMAAISAPPNPETSRPEMILPLNSSTTAATVRLTKAPWRVPADVATLP